jgi:hypothetical protein
MNEDKIMSYRLKKEREEKQIRKEAYMLQAVAEAKAKMLDKADMLEQLVLIKLGYTSNQASNYTMCISILMFHS